MPSRLAAGPAALSRGSSSRRPANLFCDCNQWPRRLLPASHPPARQLPGRRERALVSGIIDCDFIIKERVGAHLAPCSSAWTLNLPCFFFVHGGTAFPHKPETFEARSCSREPGDFDLAIPRVAR